MLAHRDNEILLFSSAEGAEITDEVWLILLRLPQRLDPHLAGTALTHAPTPADLRA